MSLSPCSAHASFTSLVCCAGCRACPLSLLTGPLSQHCVHARTCCGAAGQGGRVWSCHWLLHHSRLLGRVRCTLLRHEVPAGRQLSLDCVCAQWDWSPAHTHTNTHGDPRQSGVFQGAALDVLVNKLHLWGCMLLHECRRCARVCKFVCACCVWGGQARMLFGAGCWLPHA